MVLLEAAAENPFRRITFDSKADAGTDAGTRGTTVKGAERVAGTMGRDLRVDGMSCGGCEASVVDALRDVDGVESAEADHETGRVSVEGEADEEALRAAVEEAGYALEETG
jgi:copper chaperone